MGIADIFGFGKKEEKKKTPVTHLMIPADVTAIRTRIEAENRENYPNMERYQEIQGRARGALATLDAIIKKGEHAEEAGRIKEDLKKKMGQLTDKVNKNTEAAKKEDGDDYVANNMEYIERKNMRNHAKTLFTECLDAMEALMKCCQEERPKHGATLEAATRELIRAMLTLHADYFTKHAEDKEVKEIRKELLEKINGLNAFFVNNSEGLKKNRLEAKAQANLSAVAKATRIVYDASDDR